MSGNVNAVFVHQSEAEFVGGAGASWQHMLSELPRSVFHVGPFTCRALCQCVSKSQCIANIRLVDMMILTMKSAVMNASQRTRPFAPETLLVPGQVCVCVKGIGDAHALGVWHSNRTPEAQKLVRHGPLQAFQVLILNMQTLHGGCLARSCWVVI